MLTSPSHVELEVVSTKTGETMEYKDWIAVAGILGGAGVAAVLARCGLQHTRKLHDEGTFGPSKLRRYCVSSDAGSSRAMCRPVNLSSRLSTSTDRAQRS